MGYILDLSPTEHDVMIHVLGLEPLGFKDFSMWFLSQLVRIHKDSMRWVIIRLERKGLLICRHEGNKRNGKKTCRSIVSVFEGD